MSIQLARANWLLGLPMGTPWPDSIEVQDLAILQAWQGDEQPPRHLTPAIQHVAHSMRAASAVTLEPTGRVINRPARTVPMRRFEGVIHVAPDGATVCTENTIDTGTFHLPASHSFEKKPHLDRVGFTEWLATEGVEPSLCARAWLDSAQPQAHQSAPVPEVTPAQQPAPAAPPEAVLMPPQAVPAAVAESMPNLAHCLPTAQVATVFDALPFSAERWRKNLSGNKWTWAAKRSAGEQGGATAMWCPLTLAQLVHARVKDPKKKAATLKTLNSLFNRNELLAPHRDEWGKFFQLMSND